MQQGSCVTKLSDDTAPIGVRRRASVLLWKEHLENGRSVQFPGVLGRVLVAHGLSVLSHWPAWMDVDFLVLSGFLLVAPAPLQAERVQSLLLKLTTRAVYSETGDCEIILSTLDACLKRALRERSADVGRKMCAEEVEKKLLYVVRCYWDSDFPGVASACLQAFETWLSIVNFYDASGAAARRKRLMRHYFNDYSWQCRGKYKALASLLASCSAEEVASVVADLNYAFVAAVRNSQVAPVVAKLWKVALVTCPARGCGLVATLASLLRDANSRVCVLLDKHWLPALAKVDYERLCGLVECFQVALRALNIAEETPINLTSLSAFHEQISKERAENISDYDRLCRASAIVLKHVYKFAPSSRKEQLTQDYGNLWLELATSLNTTARAQCFEIRCRYWPKRHLGANQQVVHSFLLSNIAVTESAFRLSLCASYECYLAAGVELDAELVASFLGSLMANLFPGANYQRRCSSLKLLHILLSLNASAKSTWLESLRRDEGEWLKIISWSTLHACGDLREVACKISTAHCEPAQRSFAYLQLALEKMFGQALVEWDAGVDLFLAQLHHFQQVQFGIFDKTLSKVEHTRPVDQFIFDDLYKCLLDRLECRSANCCSLLRCCARLWPVVEHLISVVFVTRLASLLVSYIKHSIELLGSTERVRCPSLASMRERAGALSQDDETLLPPALKVKLWNVTEACHVLTRCAQLLANHDQVEQIEQIGETLFMVLLRNRSVIVLDLVEKYLDQFLATCIQYKKAQVYRTLAIRLLTMIMDTAFVSAIRRAGGYPPIVHCFVSTAVRFGRQDFVDFFLNELIELTEELEMKHMVSARSPTPCVKDKRMVRILNCLRTITLSSECRNRVRPLLPRLYHLAASYFRSSVWAIRNAAAILLSAVVRCLFPMSSLRQDVVHFWASYANVMRHCRCLLENCKDMVAIFPSFVVLQNLTLERGDIEDTNLSADLKRICDALFKCCQTFKDERLLADIYVALQLPAARAEARGRVQTGDRGELAAPPLPTVSAAHRGLANALVEPEEAAVPLEELLKNCRGVGGVSAQALSLPLLTDLMLKGRCPFPDWSECVLVASNAAHNERLRYAAALCLCKLDRWNFKQFPDKCAKLALAVCSLLLEENEEIRLAICRMKFCRPAAADYFSPARLMGLFLGQLARDSLCQPLVEFVFCNFILPSPEMSFAVTGEQWSLMDSPTYQEGYTALLNYYQFIRSYANLHPARFGQMVDATLTDDRRAALSALASRLSGERKEDFWPRSSDDFELLVRYSYAVRLLRLHNGAGFADLDDSLARLMPAFDRVAHD